MLTIGHSTRALAELIELLKFHRVERVVDVRAWPRSARHPQFNQDHLAQELPAVGIAYTHQGGLGGLRKLRPDSRHQGLRNAAFRGYADYMDSEAFGRELDALIERAGQERIAIMCAEAKPAQCHRSLVADALLARGIPVEHIVGLGPTEPHALTPRARVVGAQVEYPAAPRGRRRG